MNKRTEEHLTIEAERAQRDKEDKAKRHAEMLQKI